MTVLDIDENSTITEFVLKVKRRFDDYERRYRKPHTQLKFKGFDKINVDVMIDPRGRQYVSEVHILPEISIVPDPERYARKVVNHLLELCQREKYEAVYFIGEVFETYPLYMLMKQTRLPCRFIDRK